LPKPEEAPPSDPRLRAVDRVRETAKWLIASFAAIGALLVGQSAFANLGKLDWQSGRFWAAIIAAMLGLVGVAVAIWKTTTVLLPADVFVLTLLSDEKFAQIVDENPELLEGCAGSAADFAAIYLLRRRDFLNAAASSCGSPGDPAQDALQQATALFAELGKATDNVTSRGLYDRVRRDWSNAKLWIFAAALVAGAALVVFAWAANPSETKAATAPSPALSAPSPMLVSLSEEGVKRLKPLMQCSAAQLQALAIGRSAPNFEVVTTPTAHCRSIRFVVTEVLGTAVPVGP
jgi:hypothetical protein